jgi:putrescine transport system permease protein
VAGERLERKDGQARQAACVRPAPPTWVSLILVAPLAIVAAMAFAVPRDGVPPFQSGLSLDSLTLVASDPTYRDALLRSIRVASVTTVWCLILGFPVALGISRASARSQTVLVLLTMLPFWTGFLMRINAWIGRLSDNGFLARILGGTHLLYTGGAMYIGLVCTYIPFMVLPLYARLSRLDPVLREAAVDLGATGPAVLREVIVPFSLPGILAGSALVFVPVLGEYVIPTLLGGPGQELVGTVLWEGFFGDRDWPTAASVAMWLLVLLVLAPLLLLGLRRRWVGGERA